MLAQSSRTRHCCSPPGIDVDSKSDLFQSWPGLNVPRVCKIHAGRLQEPIIICRCAHVLGLRIRMIYQPSSPLRPEVNPLLVSECDVDANIHDGDKPLGPFAFLECLEHA